MNSGHNPARIKKHINETFHELWRDLSSTSDTQAYEVINSQNIERWGNGNWEQASPLFASRSNSQKFVGYDFHKNPDIIALGCSVTAPVGIPYELSWPNIIGAQTGKKVNVIAFPGAGTQRIVTHLFAHIRNYGVPRSIFFLIPDFERVQLFQWTGRIVPGGLQRNWDCLNASYEETDLYYQDPRNGGRGRTGKPLVFNDVFGRQFEIPVEVAITQVSIMLQVLINFCAISEIELKIASWHERTQYGISLIDDAEFIKIPFTATLSGTCGWCCVPTRSHITSGEFNDAMCHHPENNVQEALWLFGYDLPNPHPGVHPHIHYAEMFLGHEVGQDLLRSIAVKTKTT